MQCVSDADVLGLLEGSLDEERRTAIERHLDGCAECLEVVTLASKTSVALSRQDTPDRWTLEDEPAEGGLAGTSLGRYEILQPLGRGGMGMVYAARDVQLGRRVAIKVVVPDQAASPQSNLALLREAQALARITQPNVLTVYDVGSAGDTVFLAAELVEGHTLDEWLSHPRRWRHVIDVFVQAGRGLEAVHAAGLVHRDFKPSNVLVGDDGRVRVFDFGLVRFTDIAPAGRELAGTPIYMSPEQRRGEPADARSDQYSLCLVMHEALWGALPGGAPASRAAQQTIDRPPGWLRDAVRRGLERDPARRYPSMRALLDVLERGLTRRRRRLQASLAGLAVAVAATTAGLGYLHGRDEPMSRCSRLAAANPWGQARKAPLLEAFRATGLAYAPITANLVERVLDRFVVGWRGQRREACLAQEDDRSASKELHDRRVACLDQQWIRFEAILGRFAQADRQMVNRASQLLEAVPDPEACLRPPQMSWPADPRARERFAAHVRDAAEVASLAQAGKPKEAAPRAEELRREAAALAIPGVEADALYLSGHIAALQGRHEEAVALLEKTLWSAEAAGHDALVAAVSVELIQVISSDRRRPEEARRFVELARAAATRIGSVGARAKAARAIGNLELQAGHFDAAQASLHEALELIQGRDPPDSLLVANIELDLANVDYQRGRPVDAVPRIRRAIAAIVRDLGPDHPSHAQALNQLGNALLETREPTEGARAYERAIAIQEAALGPDHLDTIKTRANTVGVYIASGQFDRARTTLEDVVARLERIDPEHPILGTALNNLGEVNRLLGDLDAADRFARRALELRRKRYGESHPQVARSLINLAQISFYRDDLRTTRALCEQARAAMAGSDAGFRAMAANAETCLGEVELASGRRAAAREILERALTMHGDQDFTRLADTQFALARALPRSERDRAIELARMARASFERDPIYRAEDIAFVDAWLKDPTLVRWPARGRPPRSR